MTFCDVLHLLFGFQVARASEWRKPLNHNERTRLFFAWQWFLAMWNCLLAVILKALYFKFPLQPCFTCKPLC